MEILVVVFGIGYHASFLSGQVDAQRIAESHADHIVSPCVHGSLYIGIFLAVAEHVVESPTEITIARGTDGGNQWQGGGMSVAAYGQATEMESVTARIGGFGGDDSFLKESQRLTGLEGRTGRILSHDGTVEQGLVGVGRQYLVVLSTLTTHHDTRVVGG